MADYKSNSRDDVDDNEKALEEFDNWLSNTSSTYSTTHPGRNYLKIATNLKSGQRGLIACCNINANQCIYSIPLKDLRYILTPLRCTFLLNTCQCFLTKEFKQNHKIQLNSFDILVTFIYHCKYPSSAQRDCFIQNIWSPYINVLPNRYPNPVSYILSSTDYNNSSIFNANCTTSSSPYFHSYDINIAFRNILKRVTKSWHNLKPLLCHITNQDEHTSDTPSNEFLWAWFTVNSRCVSCPMKQESILNIQQFFQALFKSYSQSERRILNMIIENIIQLKDDTTSTTTTNTDDNNNDGAHTIALIPFFDFFNHNPNIATNTRLILSNDTNTLELYLDQEVSENEQVFINYGPHDNLTLFTEYGFSLPHLEANATTTTTTTTNDVIYLSSCFLIDLFIQLYSEIKVTTYPPSVIPPRPLPSTTTTTAAASTSTTTSFSSVSSSHLSPSTSQRSEYKSEGDQQSDIVIMMREYFYLILAKLHLPQPKTSSIQDDILWKSVYVSNSVDLHNSSYYLSLILFLMYTTFITGTTTDNHNNNDNISKQNHRSLDDIFNISEDLISTTIQPVLNRIYTLLLDNIKCDREKILHLLKSSLEAQGRVTRTPTTTQPSCTVNDFCKEFLYYLEQRECFVQGLMMN
nr:unnamed protein product [Trichobilharzia regenti]